MRRTLSVIAVTIVAALALAAAAVADQSWTDPAGDANGAPDITGVTVTNDAKGIVKLKLAVALVPGSYLFVLVDGNLNGSLSDKSDAVIVVASAGETVLTLAFSLDDAGNFLQKPLPSLKSALDGSSVTVSFALSDLGITPVMGPGVATVFAFAAATTTSARNDADAIGDLLPDESMLLYALEKPRAAPASTPKAVKPVIGPPSITPGGVVAGRRVTVRLEVSRADNGKPLTSGKMICDPSIAGKVLPHAESFQGGVATLSFTVPKTAAGKQLKVRVTIASGGRSATRVATFRIR